MRLNCYLIFRNGEPRVKTYDKIFVCMGKLWLAFLGKDWSMIMMRYCRLSYTTIVRVEFFYPHGIEVLLEFTYAVCIPQDYRYRLRNSITFWKNKLLTGHSSRLVLS